eukprot:5131871-Amphidinium_carterae.1
MWPVGSQTEELPKAGERCRRRTTLQPQQQQPPPPTDVSHLTATDTSWIYTVVVDDRDVVLVSPVTVDVSPDENE